jgi:hypothetical protein
MPRTVSVGNQRRAKVVLPDSIELSTSSSSRLRFRVRCVRAADPLPYVTSRFAAQTDTYWSERDCVSLCITEVIVFIQNE